MVSIVVSVYSLLFETDMSNVIWNDSKVARIGCSIIIGYMIAGKVDNSFWTLRFGSYRIDEHRKFRRACAYAQSRQSLRLSHTQTMEVEKGSDQIPGPDVIKLFHTQLN